MRFFDFLEKVTIAKLIKWEPTGQKIKTSCNVHKGYKTNVDGYDIKTVTRLRPKGFLKRGWDASEAAFGIVVRKNNKTFAFTSDPKTIPGEKNDAVIFIFLKIQSWVEDEDIITSLTKNLANMFYS